MTIYVLSTEDLSIVDQAVNYELAWKIVNSRDDSKDLHISPNPPLASIIIWEDQLERQSTDPKQHREATS